MSKYIWLFFYHPTCCRWLNIIPCFIICTSLLCSVEVNASSTAGGDNAITIIRTVELGGMFSEIKELQGDLWVLDGEEKAWRVKKGQKLEKILKGTIYGAKELQGAVWVLTDEGAWKIEKGEKGVQVTEGSVNGIVEIQEAVWILTDEGVWKFEKGEKRVKIFEDSVTSIKDLQGALWRCFSR